MSDSIAFTGIIHQRDTDAYSYGLVEFTSPPALAATVFAGFNYGILGHDEVWCRLVKGCKVRGHAQQNPHTGGWKILSMQPQERLRTEGRFSRFFTRYYHWRRHLQLAF